MKPTIFTDTEKELITQKLIQRKGLYKNQGYSKKESEVNEVLKKINSEWDNIYSKKFKSLISGCINEILHPIESRIIKYLELSPLRFTELTEQDKEELKFIDLCFSILNKTGFKKSALRFSHVFQKIDKLKNSELIGISRTDKKNVYKIGFLNSNESMILAMNSEVDLFNKNLDKLTNKQIEDFPTIFTDFLPKNEAKELINNCKPAVKNDETLAFIKFLLN